MQELLEVGHTMYVCHMYGSKCQKCNSLCKFKYHREIA